MSKRIPRGLVMLGTSWAIAASAQVKSFDRPPTLEELRKALPAASAPADGGPRSRGLVWTASPVKGDVAGGGSPAAATPAAPAPAAEAGTGVALPINFEPGSSRLTPQANAFIEPIAMLMKTEPSLRMLVEGHTDATGPAQRNLMLSWDRAMAVFKTLVERYGIEANRLQPVGKGSSELMDASNPEGAANRRVQFRPIG